MTDFPVLKNAPIIEALIDIRVKLDSSYKVEKLKEIHDGIKTDYPEIQKQRISQIIFGTDNKNKDIPPVNKTNGYRFISKDKKQILQTRLDGFTFSRLKPYKNWDSLKKEAKRLWAFYKKYTNPSVITRVAVRYINNLNIKMPINDFGDYLTAPPTVPEKLPQGVSSFLTRVVIQEPDIKANAIIIQALEQIVTETAPIILDIDVFKNQSDMEEIEIWNTMEKLRDKTNIGRADIIASIVLSKKLEIIPSEPPPLHADIKNWPNEKSEQRLIAIELAQEAKLFLS